MDNKKQSEDQRPLIKKLVLPLTFLLGGLLVFAVLYYFFLSGSLKTTSKPVSESQEAFQAPAEISPSLQIECQSSVEKIDRLSNCQKIEREFLTKMNMCANYTYVLDQAETLPTDGLYSDLVFHAIDCYKKSGADQKMAAQTLLKKVQAELPAWDVSFGPVSCNSDSTFKAYAESLEADQLFKCTSATALETVLSALRSQNIALLNQFLWSKHLPRLGLRDSDVLCPVPIQDILTSLKKNLSPATQIQLNQESKADAQSVFIEINRSNDQLALLRLDVNPEGCLYVHSLLIPGFGQEDSP